MVLNFIKMFSIKLLIIFTLIKFSKQENELFNEIDENKSINEIVQTIKEEYNKTKVCISA